MRTLFFAVAAAAAFAGACSTTDRSRGVAGRYALVEVDGRPLPINKGPLPSRSGGNTPYDYVLAHGYLDLRPDRLFVIYYEHQNSATRQVLARTEQTGTYTLSGTALTLQGMPAVHPSYHPNRWTGTVSRNNVTLRFNDQLMLFRR